MGGTIRIIKKKDGEFKSYQGWTNPVPVFTFTSKFYKDKEFANEKIEKWANVEDKSPNFNRTEYGVIFIDLDNKKVYECQGYSSIGRCHKSSVGLALAPNCHGYEYILEGSKEFISDNALVYKADTYDKVGAEYILRETKKKYVSYDEMVEISDGDNFLRKIKNGFISDDFYIDFTKYGWEVNSWMDSKPFEFFSKLIEDGYDISNTDFSTWDYEEAEEPGLKSRLLSVTRDNKLNTIV